MQFDCAAEVERCGGRGRPGTARLEGEAKCIGPSRNSGGGAGACGAQDDRAGVAASRRSGTSSTLLEPVVWSCFRILASKDASRISMVMARSLGLRVRERVR